MATLKEIKGRIRSVGDTLKITNAMYLVSSAKFKSSRVLLSGQGEYFDLLGNEIRSISSGVTPEECAYMREGSGKTAVLVITSDKGLCGDYNKAVLRAASKTVDEYPECTVYGIGEKARKYFAARGKNIDTGFDYSIRTPEKEFSAEIAQFFCEGFKSGKFGRVIAVYTSTNGGSKKKVCVKQILPIEPEEGTDEDENIEFFPSKASVLGSLVPIYIDGIFHSMILQSYVAEQNSRMMAMDSANTNGRDLLDELTLQYNHLRQNAITTEITEISGERMHK